MSLLAGSGFSPDGSGRDAQPVRQHLEERRTVRRTRLGTGTIACPECDAPVAVGAGCLKLEHRLRCPYCDHAGPLRHFLSLAAPSRPARVVVHVHAPWRGALRTE